MLADVVEAVVEVARELLEIMAVAKELVLVVLALYASVVTSLVTTPTHVLQELSRYFRYGCCQVKGSSVLAFSRLNEVLKTKQVLPDDDIRNI